MRTAIKKILAIVLSLCMVATGLNISNAKAATETNVANVSTSNIFLTSNANNGSEGFLSVGNGFSAINACNESLTSGNNLLGATATTDENNVCENLTYTLTYANGTPVAVDDTLNAGETKSLKLTLSYSASVAAAALPKDDVSISNLAISIIYAQSANSSQN